MSNRCAQPMIRHRLVQQQETAFLRFLQAIEILPSEAGLEQLHGLSPAACPICVSDADCSAPTPACIPEQGECVAGRLGVGQEHGCAGGPQRLGGAGEPLRVRLDPRERDHDRQVGRGAHTLERGARQVRRGHLTANARTLSPILR